MLLRFITLCSITWARSESTLTIATKYGPIEGTTRTIFDGKTVDTFLGIPYAAPPIGSYRFAPPQPPIPWNKTLSVKTLPLSCLQAETEEMKKVLWYASLSPESEDCLYLNVWRPSQNWQDELAVMIWIPGGGFIMGSSNIPLYDGAVLASKQNVIVVSMNYRLAMFGFLYMNTTDVPGNAGLQDQIAVIKWVKENIHAFGGDPNRITVFGESAGSMSVGYHLTNPQTFDLFRYAIMESGPIAMPRYTLPMKNILIHSQKLAENVNCPIDNQDETIACLRAKPADLLLRQALGVPPYAVRMQFVPVRNGIEVPIDPFNGVQKVPTNNRRSLLGGNIPNEFASFSRTLFPEIPFNENFTVSEKDWTILLTKNYQLRDERLQAVMTHEYTNFTGVNDRNQLRIEATNCNSDCFMICPQIDFTKDWVTEANKVFYYYFTHRPSKYVRTPFPEWIGPTHGDDVPFVFGLPLDPQNGYTVAEKTLSEQIMTLWATFAKTGDPNGCNGITWPALKPNQELTFLELGEKIAIRTFLKERKCAFWRDVYPKLISIQQKLDGKGLDFPVF